MTALLASIVTGQCEITRILLEFGAQVEIPGVRYNLWDGIIFCDDCPCEQLFRIFVEQGVDLHIVNEVNTIMDSISLEIYNQNSMRGLMF